MTRSFHGLGIALAGALVLVGCSFTSDSRRSDDPADGDGGAGSGPSNQATDDTKAGKLAFTPSNIPLSSSAAVGDVDIEDRCEIDTDAGTIECAGGGGTFTFGFAKVEQGNGAGMVGVFTMHSLRIEPTALLAVKGSLPIVLFAASTIDVQGGIDASGTFAKAHGGGFVSSASGVGGGAGGGGSGSANFNGGAGGSFCGIGGTGGVNAPPGALPASSYGSTQLTPLVGGSAGGAGVVPSYGGLGGAGGGAVQLVAGSAINVGLGGTVSAGGGGGGAPGGAGGSGGALLVESPIVIVLGKLAANGGGGALFDGGAPGQNGFPSAVVAQGSAPTAGAGSAGSRVDATNGSITGRNSNSSGGGGGGAGRIRINTTTGAAQITGVVSPAPTTPCFSQGLLRM